MSAAVVVVLSLGCGPAEEFYKRVTCTHVGTWVDGSPPVDPRPFRGGAQRIEYLTEPEELPRWLPEPNPDRFKCRRIHWGDGGTSIHCDEFDCGEPADECSGSDCGTSEPADKTEPGNWHSACCPLDWSTTGRMLVEAPAEFEVRVVPAYPFPGSSWEAIQTGFPDGCWRIKVEDGGDLHAAQKIPAERCSIDWVQKGDDDEWEPMRGSRRDEDPSGAWEAPVEPIPFPADLPCCPTGNDTADNRYRPPCVPCMYVEVPF